LSNHVIDRGRFDGAHVLLRVPILSAKPDSENLSGRIDAKRKKPSVPLYGISVKSLHVFLCPFSLEEKGRKRTLRNRNRISKDYAGSRAEIVQPFKQ
jgi:hypothetical protein